MEHFFPLEIDQDDGFILPPEEAGLLETVTMKKESKPLSKPESIPELEPSPEPEPVPEDKASDDDWLSGHLDLLNKISDDVE